MFIHIFKMIWNRKKHNLLIIIEVTIAFIVVFTLASISIKNYMLYLQPLGFNYQDMWQVRPIESGGPLANEHEHNQLQFVINALKKMPEIDNVQLMKEPAFRNSVWQNTRKINGKEITYNINIMDDGAPETFGMKLLKGRWFGAQDSHQNYDSVIINKRFANLVFPDENPIGKNIASPQQDAPQRENRIIGVFEDFRQYGEFNQLVPYAIWRYDTSKPATSPGRMSVQLKLKSGIGTAFEAKLIPVLKGITPHKEYNIRSWANQRKIIHRQILTPIIVMLIVGSFLILMVSMGLFGVLWQNITRRRREIGLRRACGATSNGIHLQVICELLLVTMLGILIAFLLLLQVPILGIMPELTWSLFWISLVTSIIFMLVLATLCAFYPGKVATSFAPAEALHYE